MNLRLDSGSTTEDTGRRDTGCLEKWRGIYFGGGGPEGCKHLTSNYYTVYQAFSMIYSL